MNNSVALPFVKPGTVFFVAIAFGSLFMLFVNFNDMVSGKYLNTVQNIQTQGIFPVKTSYFYF